ncbi:MULTISPECIES: hypothetical protein [unclassified Eikenella]|nr:MULTISPECIES: hypothetical protein [unclassified Eikenella]VDG99732.1 Uncharacterised protein [Helicobacter pametensis]
MKLKQIVILSSLLLAAAAQAEVRASPVAESMVGGGYLKSQLPDSKS